MFPLDDDFSFLEEYTSPVIPVPSFLAFRSSAFLPVPLVAFLCNFARRASKSSSPPAPAPAPVPSPPSSAAHLILSLPLRNPNPKLHRVEGAPEEFNTASEDARAVNLSDDIAHEMVAAIATTISNSSSQQFSYLPTNGFLHILSSVLVVSEGLSLRRTSQARSWLRDRLGWTEETLFHPFHPLPSTFFHIICCLGFGDNFELLTKWNAPFHQSRSKSIS